MIGSFVWTDLSTYDLAAAERDYNALFGWQFEGDAAYRYAVQGTNPAAALFTMPERLAALHMPSFWMSYVQVQNLEASLTKARQHEGVIVEVAPFNFSPDARATLIRDPSGAGFTLYEGPNIQVAPNPATRYHHCADKALVEAFYADLFGWRFTPAQQGDWPVYDILHPSGAQIAQLEEVPIDIRGKFSYWMPCFTVENLHQTFSTLTSRRGKIFIELPGGRHMAADRQGAHFMLVQSD